MVLNVLKQKKLLYYHNNTYGLFALSGLKSLICSFFNFTDDCLLLCYLCGVVGRNIIRHFVEIGGVRREGLVLQILFLREMLQKFQLNSLCEELLEANESLYL